MSDRPDDSSESAPLLLSRTRMHELLQKPPEVPTTSSRSNEPPPKRSIRARLGFAGLLLVAFLVWVAVFADMLAADLPIACKVHGQVYLFPNVTQPVELVAMDRIALRGSTEWSISPLSSYGPRTGDAEIRLRGPLKLEGHLLGTDIAGRDVFARLVHGTRAYLVFAFAAVVLSLLFGGTLGAIAGLVGGPVDALVSRSIETVSAFPPLVLIVGIQAAVPTPTVGTLFVAIALTRFPEVARLVRAEVMSVATKDYVVAARALGASPMRVLHKHIAPNVRGQIAVLGAVGVPAVILVEASLDFLRIGVPAGAASWGETMSQFREASQAWWLLFFPALLMFATVVALNLVGEARRDSLDPRVGH